MGSANTPTLRHDNGPEAVARRFDAARRVFVAEIERGRGGLIAHREFSARMDEIVVVAAAEMDSLGAPAALCAIGGYGHGSLCLHSDVDLLFVFGGRVQGAEERFLATVLHPLWDARLTVSHQVRTVDEFEGVDGDDKEDEDPEFTLALLDARLLAGDRGVFDRVHRRFGVHDSPGRRTALLGALLRLTEARHASYNETIYQAEPDVKSSPGGLRDMTVVRLLARLVPEPGPPTGAPLDEAEEFLLRVRSLLHLAAGRNVNVLSHELQEPAAERLRLAGPGATEGADALLSRYFGHARVVARTLARARRLAGPAPRKARGDLIGENLELAASCVRFLNQGRASREPASWLLAFEAALDRNVAMADEALALIARHAPACTFEDLLPTRRDRRRFTRLLTPREGLYARLSEMRDCGLLDRLIPGFAANSCRTICDFSHRYTVDEHTLLTIRGLERLLAADASRDRFRSILGELRFPERLVLALLVHDLWTLTSRDHPAESARLAGVMGDWLELDTETRQDIEFLVGQHLQMSHVAFRRDSEDPAVVQRFAALVAIEERLKMLCLMTLVDIEAVGTATLTPWKEELLWRLYVDTYNQLTLAYGDQVIERGHAAVAALQAARPPDIGEQELAGFLEGFPQRYLVTVDSPHVYQHARLARDIREDEVHLSIEQKGDVWELAVVTRDKPLLFSNICGTLSSFGVDILRGSAMTSPNGVVLDIFQFLDLQGAFRLNPGAPARLESLLQDVVAGRQDVTALLLRAESGPLYGRGPQRVSPVVYFDDAHSHTHTILEIVAQDAPGLLHRISRVISQRGCDVDLVLISTEGSKAIDVFHLTRGATKLAQDVRMALKQDLERVLDKEC